MTRKQRNRRRMALGSRSVVLLLLVTAAALVAYKVNLAIVRGPGWDTYAFLNNAAEFAGRGTGYTELHRPPLLSWLTSLAFQAGFPVHESVIQWLDGLLSLSGLVAFYLVFRRRVPPVIAGLASLSLLGVSPLWQYLGSGYTDLPSVALSGWLILSAITAMERSPRWLIATGILFVLATLMRYTALLIVFPAAVWILLRWRPFRQARYICAALIAAIVAYLPAGLMYAARFGDSLFPFIFAFGVSETVTAPGGEGSVVAAGPFYLSHLSTFVGGGQTTLAVLILLFVAAIGLTWAVGNHLESHRPRLSRIMLVLLGLGIGALAQTSGGMIARQTSVMVMILMIWIALGHREDTSDGSLGRVASASALDATMLAWLLTYFSFHGNQNIQVPRYIITMAPPLLYFIALGWQRMADDMSTTLGNVKNDGGRTTFSWIPTVLAPTAFALITIVAVCIVIANTERAPDPLVQAAKETASILKESEPNLNELVVYSDLWPLTSWYADTHARAMPFFIEDAAFSHELNKSTADYYVTIRARRFEDFDDLNTVGAATILTRTQNTAPDLPRVMLVGTAWDNYLETVTNYDFYLDSDKGRYGWEGTAFIDELSAEELAAYDAVALFDVRWRNRALGEAALLEYVSNGGSLIIDASGNVGSLPYEFGGTVVFNTVVRRGMLPVNTAIEIVDAPFAARYPELSDIRTEPFIDETGGGWFGADYEPLPSLPEFSVVARAGARPIVAIQRIGKGRVYWIGYNLTWHAFITESVDERALIRAVFRDALSP